MHPRMSLVKLLAITFNIKETRINKTLHNSKISMAKENVKDLRIVGNGDAFRLRSNYC